MTMLSRRSFLKLSVLTAASAAVAAVASGCTIQISQPGFTMASTALQTAGPVKIKMSNPLIIDGQHYVAAFIVQNNSDDAVKVPLSAFSATYKNKPIEKLTASFGDELTLSAGGSQDIKLYLQVAEGTTVGSDLKIKFRMKGSNGYSCIAYQFDAEGGAKATIPYTEFDF